MQKKRLLCNTGFKDLSVCILCEYNIISKVCHSTKNVEKHNIKETYK